MPIFLATRSARGAARALVLCLLPLGLALAGAHPAAAAGPGVIAGQGRAAPPAGAQALCRAYSWACAASGQGAAPLTAGQVDLARAVSLRVNREVREISDRAQYGTDERWALPTRRGGDCEDFALEKKRRLVAAGLPPERLLLASVLDRRRDPHAVLVLRTGAGDLVLDNLDDRVVGWRATGYTFLRMQDPADPSGWVAVLDGGIFARS